MSRRLSLLSTMKSKNGYSLLHGYAEVIVVKWSAFQETVVFITGYLSADLSLLILISHLH